MPFVAALASNRGTTMRTPLPSITSAPAIRHTFAQIGSRCFTFGGGECGCASRPTARWLTLGLAYVPMGLRSLGRASKRHCPGRLARSIPLRHYFSVGVLLEDVDR